MFAIYFYKLLACIGNKLLWDPKGFMKDPLKYKICEEFLVELSVCCPSVVRDFVESWGAYAPKKMKQDWVALMSKPIALF